MLVACLIGLVSCIPLTGSRSGGLALRTYPAARIQATWLLGASGEADQIESFFPTGYTGALCPVGSLHLLNHSSAFAGQFAKADSIIVMVGNCIAQIHVAICATASAGGGATTIPTCAVDPLETPESNLQFDDVLGPTPEGTTPALFSVNVFWCASGDFFNLGQTSSAKSTDCISP
jgi:hypothetical protein